MGIILTACNKSSNSFCSSNSFSDLKPHGSIIRSIVFDVLMFKLTQKGQRFPEEILNLLPWQKFLYCYSNFTTFFSGHNLRQNSTDSDYGYVWNPHHLYICLVSIRRWDLRRHMKTSSHHVTTLYEITIAYLWCSLCCKSAYSFEQTVDMWAIWDAMTLMCHCIENTT